VAKDVLNFAIFPLALTDVLLKIVVFQLAAIKQQKRFRLDYIIDLIFALFEHDGSYFHGTLRLCLLRNQENRYAVQRRFNRNVFDPLD